MLAAAQYLLLIRCKLWRGVQEFAGPMAHVLQSCWRMHGERLMHKPAGGSEGYSARNFSLSLDVFIDALRLAPICEPAEWLEGNGRALLLATSLCLCFAV